MKPLGGPTKPGPPLPKPPLPGGGPPRIWGGATECSNKSTTILKNYTRSVIQVS